MLKELNVENYALIDKLNISFSDGMSIITGETGAGKSILLGALSLVLGGRADSNVLKDTARNCIVEGVFHIEGYGLESFLSENDIDYEPDLIICRTINPAGKSRAFINDTPVNATIIKDISHRLLDIHSQHQNLLLSSSKFQLSVIDAVTDFGKLKDEYLQYFSAYRAEEKKLEDLLARSAKAKADYDYIKFQFEQLQQANLKADEQNDLEIEIQELSNVEEIKSGYEKLTTLLSNEEISVINMLKEAENTLGRLSKVHLSSNDLSIRLKNILVEVKDISEETNRINNSLEINPERLSIVENRLNTIYDLQQKHRVATIGELLELQKNYGNSLTEIENFDEMIAKTQKAVNDNLDKVKDLALKISALRQKTIPLVEKHVSTLLKSLGMPNIVFKVELTYSEHFSSDGADSITFLFSANRDMPPREISKVASGGEMSRLMLALKSLLVKGTNLPTIIFDEIDTGVSGEVADKMGNIINELSEKAQVINITHLPQIAAKGNAHYLVYKEDTATATFTKVRKLNNDERILEIAKMLSGSKITDAAVEHAKELFDEKK
ncbi:MAG: DNA repair protein RecN [Prevotellaceae bacterium]|jgi:DNA repair protein RecN (Recombination protein N)|nr:DNA repair protein RecN [Prevotellaceae bacterium]